MKATFVFILFLGTASAAHLYHGPTLVLLGSNLSTKGMSGYKPRLGGPPPPLKKPERKTPEKSGYPSSLLIPYQVSKDLNNIIKVSYWSTRKALIGYMNSVHRMIGYHPLDTEQEPNLFDAFYSPV